MHYSSLEVIFNQDPEGTKEGKQSLGFKRIDSRLGTDFFRVGETLCEAAWKGKGAQESWQIFRGNFLQTEHSILITQENKQTFQEICLVSQQTHGWAAVQKGHTQDMKVKTHNRNFASLPLSLGKSCLCLKTQASRRKGITSMEKIPGGQRQALYWGTAWEKNRQAHKLKRERFWLDIMAQKNHLG